MNRNQFINRAESDSTKKGYEKSFKKLDQFYQEKGFSDNEFIKTLNELETHERYNLLQSLVDSIKTQVSPRVTRNYFDNIFMFFLLNGVSVDYTQKKLRLKFPRISEKQFEGLDRGQVATLLSLGSDNFKAYMSVLVGAGTRETEALKLTPMMFNFNEFPVRIKLPAEITKYSIPRETYLPPNAVQRVKDLIDKKEIQGDQTIFVESWNEKTLEDFEKYFASIRTRAGLDTPGREKYQQNDITLHSFRAFFITTFTDNRLESFGHALTGHTRYMKTYYRKSLEQRQKTYASIMNKVDFEI